MLFVYSYLGLPIFIIVYCWVTFLICSLFQTMIINGTGRKKCNNSGIKTIEVSIESKPIQSIGIYWLFPGTSLVYPRDFS